MMVRRCRGTFAPMNSRSHSSSSSHCTCKMSTVGQNHMYTVCLQKIFQVYSVFIPLRPTLKLMSRSVTHCIGVWKYVKGEKRQGCHLWFRTHALMLRHVCATLLPRYKAYVHTEPHEAHNILQMCYATKNKRATSMLSNTAVQHQCFLNKLCNINTFKTSAQHQCFLNKLCNINAFKQAVQHQCFLNKLCNINAF